MEPMAIVPSIDRSMLPSSTTTVRPSERTSGTAADAATRTKFSQVRNRGLAAVISMQRAMRTMTGTRGCSRRPS